MKSIKKLIKSGGYKVKFVKGFVSDSLNKAGEYNFANKTISVPRRLPISERKEIIYHERRHGRIRKMSIDKLDKVWSSLQSRKDYTPFKAALTNARGEYKVPRFTVTDEYLAYGKEGRKRLIRDFLGK